MTRDTNPGFFKHDRYAPLRARPDAKKGELLFAALRGIIFAADQHLPRAVTGFGGFGVPGFGG